MLYMFKLIDNIFSLFIWIFWGGGDLKRKLDKRAWRVLEKGGQADYFWEGRDNRPKNSHGNRGNDLSYGQDDY